MFRTTLNNGGVIHAVTLPDIPANWPDGGTVTVTSDCGVGLGEGLPARLARQTTHPSFTGRTVTCSGCLTGQEKLTMPLVTSITDRDTDTPRKMPHGWGWWHVERMAEVIRIEMDLPDDTAILTVLNQCPHEVRSPHTFTDPADGEVLHLHPGDVLDAWRDISR